MNSQEYEHPYIAISGPMGIGKTTAAKLIAGELKYYLLEENFANNPFVANATKDPGRYAFHSEIFFLMEKFEQIIAAQQRLKDGGLVQDTPIQQDVHSYGRAQLHGAEWNLYYALYQALEPRLMKPSLIVCLETNALENMRRIRERGRDFEKDVTPNYLQRLTELNFEWIKESGIPAVYIETDHLDIVHDPAAKEHMISVIRKQL